MIETLDFVNLRNQTWHFNTNTCPLKNFLVDGGTRMTDRQKMQQAGDWEGFNYLDHELMHLEGDLIGDTTELYVQARLDFMRVICPPPGRQKNRRWGVLRLKYFGQEIMTNPCTGDSRPILPIDATNPTVGPYQVSFKVFDPYWTGLASGKRYLI